jgi:coenzyme F420-reducing hydrogenase gamma subunit
MNQSRPKVAFFDFVGCEGCQLTVIDALQTHPELLDAVEIVQFREAMSECDDEYQIAFIEGSCSRPEDGRRLQAIRDQAKLVIALGACAHMGGVNSIRNSMLHDHVVRYVYGERGKFFPNEPARPAAEVISIDYFVPGCPINRNEFIGVISALLQGRAPFIPDYPVCIECKLKENTCVLSRGGACLGPITRAGCDAICTSLGIGCEGCRGMTSNANLETLKLAFREHGLDEIILLDKFKLFQTYTLNAIRTANAA